MPFESRAIINRHRRKFEGIYNLMEREQGMAALHHAIGSASASHFIDRFKTVFGELEKQYKEIRAARQLLFSADMDGGDLGINGEFKLESPGCEVGVDWSVNGTHSSSHIYSDPERYISY